MNAESERVQGIDVSLLTEDSPEARDFSTILVGFLSEPTQGAADPTSLWS